MVKVFKRAVKARVKQGVGKVRRLANGTLRKKHVRKKLARRRGECLRCGACCKLLFRCPLLIERPDGTTACKIHKRRPENCRIFPLDERDLAERDHLLPLLPCGYRFVDVQEAAEPVGQAGASESALVDRAG